MSKITIKRSVVEQVLLALRTDDLSLVRESVIALRAALEQLQDQPEQRLDMVPAGWKLVPSTLTDTQRQAALDAWWNACDGEMYWKTVYAAMLAAAPQPPVVEQPQSVTDCHQSQPQGEQEPDAFYEWWHMRPSLTRLQAWLLWKDEQKQLERAHKIGGEA